MIRADSLIAFGPVPSRRLGRSLGINHIPPKACSYSCVYCQVGPTAVREIEPRPFYPPEAIRRAVIARVEQARRAGESIDYLTFVPDGEPTLDVRLGEAMDMLRPLGIPIAVISNGSLITRPGVREILQRADWVSLKLDSVDEAVWQRVNRPHGDLVLSEILDGMLAFAGGYRGVLTSETLLVEGMNLDDAGIGALAEFLHRLGPRTAYLSIATRPTAEAGVRTPEEVQLNRAYQILSRRVARVEYLTGYEGNAFSSTGDAGTDLLSITAVHPLREEAVGELLARTGADWRLVEGLIEEGRLRACEYEGRRFYIRCFGKRASPMGER